MRKKIAFTKVGGFSHLNQQVVDLLEAHFPQYDVEVIDVLQQLSYSKKWWLAVNLFYVFKEYGPGLFFRKRPLQRGVLLTTYLLKKIRRWISENLSPEEYVFTFQTQSLFDASLADVPHFVYTDHTAKAFLRYAHISHQDLFWRYPPAWIELEKNIYHHAALTFTTSRFAAKSIVTDYGCRPEKVACIYSGVNSSAPDKEPSFERSGKDILFVGIDWRRKGGDDLLASFERVLAIHPDATLTIVGCSPQVTVPNCRVIGRVPREVVGEYYRQATVFCLPSLIEPSAAALVEAAAHGLPIVATDVGGTADRVINGRTGYLVEPGNVEQLAGALVHLLDDPHKRRDFGRAGYCLVQERFNWQQVGFLMKENIEAVLQANGR